MPLPQGGVLTSKVNGVCLEDSNDMWTYAFINVLTIIKYIYTTVQSITEAGFMTPKETLGGKGMGRAELRQTAQ